MHIDNEIKLDFQDVLIRPKRSTLGSRAEVQLERTFKFRHSPHTWTGIPIVASNMDAVGNFDVAGVLSKYKLLTLISKFVNFDTWEWRGIRVLGAEGLEYVSITTGMLKEDEQRLSRLVGSLRDMDALRAKFLTLDVANGYTEGFMEFVARMREEYPDFIIIAGDVATADATEQLLIAGADIVKVGIGPGSVCTTRRMTGVGYPQLSALIECADAAHGLHGHIMSDGGCREPGDIAKAFGTGCDFVILGGMFAGYDETGNELYGMSSEEALNRHRGGVADYRAPEGKHVVLENKGPIEEQVKLILGGLRSSCTYVGAKSLKELPKRTTFIRVNHQHTELFKNE